MNNFLGPEIPTPAINEQMPPSLTFWKRPVLYRLTNEGFTVEERTHCFQVYTLAGVDRQSGRPSPGGAKMLLLLISSLKLCHSLKKETHCYIIDFPQQPNRVLRNSKHSTCLWTNLVTLRPNQKGKESLIKVTQ